VGGEDQVSWAIRIPQANSAKEGEIKTGRKLGREGRRRKEIGGARTFPKKKINGDGNRDRRGNKRVGRKNTGVEGRVTAVGSTVAIFNRERTGEHSQISPRDHKQGGGKRVEVVTGLQTASTPGRWGADSGAKKKT